MKAGILRILHKDYKANFERRSEFTPGLADP